MLSFTKHRIHVVAAAVSNKMGEMLISRRPIEAHQGGLWEFPGGKLQPGEDAEAGLARELEEELGIIAEGMRPLIRIRHDYPDKSILLDVWSITRFHGTPHGREGQVVRWVAVDRLAALDFPAANRSIITAVNLPTCYLITPEPGPDRAAWLAHLERRLADGLSLVQLRAKQLSGKDFRTLAAEVIRCSRLHGARVLLNAEPEVAAELGADGVHLTVDRLRQLSSRPLPMHQLVAASCHDVTELAHAQQVGVDFAVVSPVQQTMSHPDATPLGFNGLRQLTEQSRIPLYALGGLTEADLPAAFAHGAQGIAAITGLWGQA